MDVIAIVVSVHSMAVAGGGTVLAHTRANEALAEFGKAAASALWSGVQEAVRRGGSLRICPTCGQSAACTSRQGRC